MALCVAASAIAVPPSQAAAACVSGGPNAPGAIVCLGVFTSLDTTSPAPATAYLLGATVAGAWTAGGFPNANAGVAMDAASSVGGGVSVTTTNGTIGTATPNGSGIAGQISNAGGVGFNAAASGLNGAISIQTAAGSSVSGNSAGIQAVTTGGNSVNVVTGGAVSGTLGDGISTTTVDGSNHVQANGAVTGGGNGISAYATGAGSVALDGVGSVSAKTGTAIVAISGTGAVDVVQSGALVGTGGVVAKSGGAGQVIVVTQGAVTAGALGILANSADGNIYATVGTNGVSAGTAGVIANASGLGNVTVTGLGAISGGTGGGVSAFSNKGYVAVDTTGAVSGAAGISASVNGTGTISLKTAGAVSGTAGDGIFSTAADGDTNLNIGAGGVSGKGAGIDALASGAGNLHLTLAGNVAGGLGAGISSSANSGNSQIDIASGLTVSGASGVSLTSSSGNAILNNAGTITGNNGAGVAASLGTGAGSINNDGAIAGKSGIAMSVASAAAFTVNNNAAGLIDGSINATATTAVNNFGQWKNAGGSTVGTLNSTGTLSFGTIAPFGTIAVAGNATFGASSVTTIRVNSAGASDAIAVGGATTINGGTLAVQASGGGYQIGTRYTLLSSVGGITGSFTSATSNIANLLPILSSGGGNIYLNLAQYDFRGFATTRNQYAAASMVAQAASAPLSAGGSALLLALSQATPAQAQAGLAQIAGDGLIAAKGEALRQGSMFIEAVNDQQAFWRSRESVDPNGITLGLPREASAYADPGWYAGQPGPIRVRAAPPAPDRSMRMWVSGFGGEQGAKGNSADGSADQSSRIYGGAVGVDAQVGRNLLVGIAGGFSSGSFSVADRATSGQTQGAHAAVYSGFTVGSFYGAFDAGYASFTNATNRTVSVAGLPQEQEQGDFHSSEVRMRMEAGDRINLGVGAITPFTAVQAASLTTNAYTERSVSAAGPGVLGLSFASQSTRSLPAEIGFRAETKLRMGAAAIAPWAQVALVHDFSTGRNSVETMASVPGAGQAVIGPRAARDTLQLKGGVQVSTGKTSAIFVSAQADLSQHQTNLSGKGGFKYTW